VFELGKNSVDAVSEREFGVPSKLNGIVLPAWPLNWPALAATPLQDSNKMRVAWSVERGLAVVDLQGNGQGLSLLPNDDVFLTGLDFTQSNTRMTISNGGNFLMISQQRSYLSVPDIRVFDLRIRERRQLLDELQGGGALRQAACAVAGFLPGSNHFSPDELKALLRDPGAAQPC
jgi:hypothetical protein